jgi:hypothetical protein
VLTFDRIGEAHQEMADGRLPSGNTAILVGARAPGEGRG